jgi:hypothetical protein
VRNSPTPACCPTGIVISLKTGVLSIYAGIGLSNALVLSTIEAAFTRFAPLKMTAQYLVSLLSIALSYPKGDCVLRVRALSELSSFALMERLAFNSREIVQLVFAQTAALMKSVYFARGTSARTSS